MTSARQPKTLQDLKNERDEVASALAEAKTDKFADRTMLADLAADLRVLDAKISAASGDDDASDEDDEEVEGAGAGEDDSEEGAAEEESDDAVVGEDDEEELTPFYEEDEASVVEEDDGDMGGDDDSDDDDGEPEENPIRMPSKLRREMGDLAADFLDEYAIAVQRRTRNFFEALKDHLDLGVEDASDGANNKLIEKMLEDIGRKGVAKMRPHFADWREVVMRQLAKDMQAKFRAPEPELAEEVRVQVPKKNRTEVIDGVKPNATPPSLNAPVAADPDALPRAKRVAASAAPVVDAPEAIPALVPGSAGVPMGLVTNPKVAPTRPANPAAYNPFDDGPAPPVRPHKAPAQSNTVAASAQPVLIQPSAGRVSFRPSGTKNPTLE